MNCSAAPCTTPSPPQPDHPAHRPRPEITSGKPGTPGSTITPENPATSREDQLCQILAFSGGSRFSRSPKNGHSTLGFDPARFQTKPPVCYRAPWRLPGPDSHRQATTS